MESKRIFMNTLDSLEELLDSEEDSGNFDKAAEIAKCLEDVLREVDLLEKAQQFENAALLIISYVLSTSLWSSGNHGWPLNSFAGKVECLNRAMLVAKKVSGNFHASICMEAKILLNEQRNLPELMQSYNASKQCSTQRGEIISVRQLLDAHLLVNPRKYKWDPELHLDSRFYNARISTNQLSGGTLIYLWDLWKMHSLKIVECLDSLEKSDFIKCEGTVQFCFDYFGVRLQDNSSLICHLLNPAAAWVKNVNVKFIRRNGKVATIEARSFASAARKYWLQELLSVGVRVLEALQELYSVSKVKRLSEWFLSMVLLYIFDVVKFFIESKTFNMKKAEASKVQNFFLLSTKYIQYVFPLDSRESLSEDMISLRETQLSMNLLEENVSLNISIGNELTYEQVGRVVMIMLGYGKPKHDLYDRITERFTQKPSWKSFIENLRRATIEEGSVSGVQSVATSADGISNSECVQESRLRCSPGELSVELYKALKETYNVSWRANGCMSPNCFFYLVERLLILVPHPQGSFFTTKSSFVEYLLSLPSDSNPRDSLATNSEFDPTTIHDFVVSVVRDCISNSQDTKNWIETSRIDCKYYFPVLMLRLFVILCLSCLNSGSSSSILIELLPYIRLHLPKEFYKPLQRRWQDGDSQVSLVANAFKAIGDPLVLAALSENGGKDSCPDVIFLDSRSLASRKEMMETMFPRSSEACHSQPACVERNETSGKQSLETTSKIDSNTRTVGRNESESAITQNESEDSAAAVTNLSNQFGACSKGNGKNKKTNKSRKGKGGR